MIDIFQESSHVGRFDENHVEELIESEEDLEIEPNEGIWCHWYTFVGYILILFWIDLISHTFSRGNIQILQISGHLFCIDHVLNPAMSHH